MERNAAIFWLGSLGLAACSDLLAIGDFEDGFRGVPEDVDVATEGGGGSAPDTRTGEPAWVQLFAGSQADVLLRITLRDGRRLRHVLKAETPSFTIDADSSQTGVFIGVYHDHLMPQLIERSGQG